MNADFDEYCSSTISPSFTELSPSFDKNVKVDLWDSIRWNDRFDSLIKIFLYDIDGILLLFDVTLKNDFENLYNCLDLIKSYFDLETFPVLLIANKIDLFERREVEEEDIKRFQKDNHLIGYFEVSCMENINIKESFDFLVDYIIKKENN